MPVYLSYGSVWLKLKEAPEPQAAGGRRRRQRRVSAPYGLVAESVERVDLDGLEKVYEVVVPATKVSRFASRLLKTIPASFTVLIEPHGDDYVARFYAPNASYAGEAASIVARLFRELKVSGEEEVEGEVEEEEEVGEEE